VHLSNKLRRIALPVLVAGIAAVAPVSAFAHGGHPTWHADRIIGTPGDDTISARRGGDTVWGRAGNDTLNGNRGPDWLFGERGNDTLNGGWGNDRLSGGEGDDTLNGGPGNDQLPAVTHRVVNSLVVDGGATVPPRLSRGYGQTCDRSMTGTGAPETDLAASGAERATVGTPEAETPGSDELRRGP